MKDKTILAYAAASQYRVFVETGSGFGEMINAVKDMFSAIYSIELDHSFYLHCVKRFNAYPHIRCLWGDSGTVIYSVLDMMTTPAIFWLDAHYDELGGARGSLDTPIWQELNEILYRPQPNIILIDDARFFGTRKDYPTLDEIRNRVNAERLGVRQRMRRFHMDVMDDIIRIIPVHLHV